MEESSSNTGKTAKVHFLMSVRVEGQLKSIKLTNSTGTDHLFPGLLTDAAPEISALLPHFINILETSTFLAD